MAGESSELDHLRSVNESLRAKLAVMAAELEKLKGSPADHVPEGNDPEAGLEQTEAEPSPMPAPTRTSHKKGRK